MQNIYAKKLKGKTTDKISRREANMVEINLEINEVNWFPLHTLTESE